MAKTLLSDRLSRGGILFCRPNALEIFEGTGVGAFTAPSRTIYAGPSLGI